MVMASWFAFIQENGACSSLYSWSGASWHQQVQLLKLQDTVVISILFFLLPTCHFAPCLPGRFHAVVISSQYLYWASLVACAKGCTSTVRISCSSALWCVLIDLCLYCLLSSQFGHFIFSSPRQFSHVKLIVFLLANIYGGAACSFSSVRNKLLCWTFNKAQ